MLDKILLQIDELLGRLSGDELDDAINLLRERISAHSPHREQPVDFVRWVKVEEVHPNDYNPNHVANIEMKLLYTSIAHDGYTQPVVCFYDQDARRYVIVDGFHRYFVMRSQKDIYDRNHGRLPITVIDKPINERMASTVRHNRARGSHSVSGMSNLVFKMLDNGWPDSKICNELGMEPEELLRLKHITGFSKLFENVEYRKAWTTRREIEARLNKQTDLNDKP